MFGVLTCADGRYESHARIMGRAGERSERYEELPISKFGISATLNPIRKAALFFKNMIFNTHNTLNHLNLLFLTSE